MDRKVLLVSGAVISLGIWGLADRDHQDNSQPLKTSKIINQKKTAQQSQYVEPANLASVPLNHFNSSTQEKKSIEKAVQQINQDRQKKDLFRPDLFTANRVIRSNSFVKVEIDQESSVVIQDAEEARLFLEQSGGGLFGFNEGEGLAYTTSRRDEMGNVYLKYIQTYKGIPVSGSEVVLKLGSNSKAQSVIGEVQGGIYVDTVADLHADAALKTGISNLSVVDAVKPVVHKKPELYVHLDENRNATLTYKTTVEYNSKTDGYRIDEIFINADTGQIVDKISRVYSALSRKTYSLNKQCISSFTANWILPGRAVSTRTDGHARDAYNHTGDSYWFYKHMFGRDSWDNRGRRIDSTVHATFQAGFGSCTGDNAMFSAEKGLLIFGEGGTQLKNPAGARDIVGHELTHGVTAKESNLKYRNESGAINEAISDIFAAGLDAWIASGGSSRGNPSGGIRVNSDTWTIGENSARTKSMKRVMSNPTVDGKSKDNYNSRYRGSDDNGGVHINSGIMNLAFYLSSQGGSHPNRRVSTVKVPGIGIEKALRIYYHANTNLFTSSTDFRGARYKLAESAQTLFGKCSKEWEVIHLSYDAVNVPGSWQKCSSTGSSKGGSSGSSKTGGTTTKKPASPAPTRSSGSIKAARSSSKYSSRYTVRRVHDGNSRTYWLSRTIRSPYQREWVMLDLGKTTRVNSLNIDWKGTYYSRYNRVYIYKNNRWSGYTVFNKYRSGKTTVNLNTSTRYLMLQMAGAPYGKWIGIKEIKLK